MSNLELSPTATAIRIVHLIQNNDSFLAYLLSSLTSRKSWWQIFKQGRRQIFTIIIVDLVVELCVGLRVSFYCLCLFRPLKEYLQPNPATRARLMTMHTISKVRGQAHKSAYPQPEGALNRATAHARAPQFRACSNVFSRMSGFSSDSVCFRRC